MASFSIVFPFVVKVRKKNANERPRANIYIKVQLIDESSLSVSFELCCRHCSVFVSFFLHWGNWQRNVFRLNSIRRATMTETSFNNHINTFSSAFAQNAKNNPSDSSFVLIFELIYILIVWCIRRYHESNFFLDLSKLPAWSS